MILRLTITMVCSISKSDRQIERYHMIKVALFACILFEWNQPRMINLNEFWLVRQLKLIK